VSSMGVLPWTCRCGLNPSPSKNRGAPGRPPPPSTTSNVEPLFHFPFCSFSSLAVPRILPYLYIFL
jgi:hypothetical protein